MEAELVPARDPDALIVQAAIDALDLREFGSAPARRPDDEDAPPVGSVPLPRPRNANYIEQPREWDGA